ncbi:MAG: peptidyl-prolyl cis-trans isomerase [Candidatus Aminicenantes bacterium]|nr:peptidyl-prolyl cis-trans isomerase [Candidatus Aminicenantes bacterium]MDH5384570.1 peptidyl-prolyl cis-trans isomerase [Candidatus Aminicenantes bacterium]MDH5742848.1 peptidyl-prolyl cis-trans isomerase [Candidatus Aminicenantes bacterium]
MNQSHKLVVLAAVLLTAMFLYGQETVEAIVAIVNDDVITLFEYKSEHESLYQFLRSQLQGEEFSKQYEAQKKELLERMITERLLLQEARKSNINVNEQLRMYIDNIKTQYNIGSDEELRRQMAQQGIDFEVWRRQQEKALLQQAVIFSEVGRNIVIDETDVVNYFDQHPDEFTDPTEYKLRAISISSEEKNDDEVRTKIQEIDEKLAAGEDMATLASQYSEGPEKESQGDLGTFKQGELAGPLQNAVENLEAGDMTSWIQMPNGWYRIKLEEKKESRLKPFEEVKSEIENKLYNQEQQKKIQEYVEELKKRSYIKILIPDPLKYR